MAEILLAKGEPARGGQQMLAEQFGVDKSVISRDLAWARKEIGKLVEWAQIFSIGGDYLPLKLKTTFKKDRVIYQTWVESRWVGRVGDRKGVIMISECQ